MTATLQAPALLSVSPFAIAKRQIALVEVLEIFTFCVTVLLGYSAIPVVGSALCDCVLLPAAADRALTSYRSIAAATGSSQKVPANGALGCRK